MVHRQFWIKKIQSLWKKKNIIWLNGVRRVGKTFLSQSLEGVQYFDCELPKVRYQLEDVEDFLTRMKGKKLILDEIHRLPNPSEFLKIAADYYPDVKILATGSSTLGISEKFKDTLTGRKAELWLTPMNLADLESFGQRDLKHRLIFGGLPPFFLSKEVPESEFQEWIDAFWAKDIQELFRLERRWSFQKFVELLMVQSGGIFEASAFARPCEVSRGTITNYLKVLEATFIVQVVKPFSTYRPTEIMAAPKVYGFDTGFITHFKGWRELRKEDMGLLWEHLVLNEINAAFQTRGIRYWRDKRGHEIDFVFIEKGRLPIAIECKWSYQNFDSTALIAFRRQYPGQENFLVAHNVDKSFTKTIQGVTVHFVNLPTLIRRLQAQV